MITTDDSHHLGKLADSNSYWDPINIDGEDPRELLDQLRLMVLIRCAEERIGEGFWKGVIRCPCHLVIGQEVPAVGLASRIQKGDKVFGAHRSHAHYLALGGDLRKLLAEVLGRDTGCSKGMGGSMHLIALEQGLYGTVPIVGATIPIAAGAALAAKLDKSDSVVVSFLGDGATEEGVFHETLNFASNFQLPVVFVIENNLFASHLHMSLRQPFDSTCRFAQAHGVSWQRVDGNDLVAMKRASSLAVCQARAGAGPQLIEAVTYRWRGHVGDREDQDVGVARKEGLESWKKRDPIQRLALALETSGRLDEGMLQDMRKKSQTVVAEAWEQARLDPFPAAEALLDRVYFK